MKVAAGNLIDGKKLDEMPKDYIRRFLGGDFDGYICLSILGKKGVEEGIMLIQKGKIVGAGYHYLYYKKEFKGEEALKRFANALRSNYGYIHIFSLTSYQVQLIMTLNEEYLVQPTTEIKIPDTFDYSFEEALEREEKKPAKEELLKRLGLI